MIKQPKILRTAQVSYTELFMKCLKREGKKVHRSTVLSFALGLYCLLCPSRAQQYWNLPPCLQLPRAQIKLRNISQISHAQLHLFSPPDDLVILEYILD